MTSNLILEDRIEYYGFIEDLSEEKKRKIAQYKKTSYHKFTLVFDIIDFCIEIVDPEQQNLPVSQWK